MNFLTIKIKQPSYSLVDRNNSYAYRCDVAEALELAALQLRNGLSYLSVPKDSAGEPIGEAELFCPEEECEHEWTDARNKVVKSGEICLKCNSIRAGNHG